jgi:hypothetical protein
LMMSGAVLSVDDGAKATKRHRFEPK